MGKEGALQPVRSNGNGGWGAMFRGREGSTIRVAEGDKENLYPSQEKGRGRDGDKMIDDTYASSTGLGHGDVSFEHDVQREDEVETSEDDEPFVRAMRGDAARHRAAYTRMTAGAAPLPHASSSYCMPTAEFVVRDSDPVSIHGSESAPSTPSHKRPREENAEGDTVCHSLVTETSQPDRSREENGSSDSHMERPAKRVCGADDEEDRRRSAPGNMERSYTDTSRSRARSEETESVYVDLEEDLQRAQMIEKESSNSPTWLIELVQSIRPKYPDSSFAAHGDTHVTCFDCEGKVYKMNLKNVANFERHLNSKQHVHNIELRKTKGAGAHGMEAHPAQGMRPLPVAPETIVTRRSLNLSNARNQYLQALENETSEHETRMTMLQSRINASEIKSSEKIEHLRDKLEEVDQRNVEEIQTMSDNINDARAELDGRVHDVEILIEGTERRLNDKLENLDESIDNVRKESRESEKRLEDFKEKTIDRVQNFSGMLTKNDQKNLEKFEALTDRVAKVEKAEIRPERFKELEKRVRYSRDRIDDVEGKVKEVRAEVSEKIDHMTERLEASSQEVTMQQEAVGALEISMQVLTDQLKSSTDQFVTRDEMATSLRDEMQRVAEILESCQDQNRANNVSIEGVQGLIELIVERLDQSREQSSAKDEALAALKADVTKAEQRIATFETDRQDQAAKDAAASSQSLAQLEETLTDRVNALRAEHETHLEGLAKICEQQKEQAEDQQDLLETYSRQLAHCNSMIEQQTNLLEKQGRRLDDNARRMEEQDKKIEKWSIIMEHLEKTVPAFMTDLKIVDDKIEDFLEQYREEQSAKEADGPIEAYGVARDPGLAGQALNTKSVVPTRWKAMRARPRLGKRNVRMSRRLRSRKVTR